LIEGQWLMHIVLCVAADFFSVVWYGLSVLHPNRTMLQGTFTHTLYFTPRQTLVCEQALKNHGAGTFSEHIVLFWAVL
jgi:hypothetical protein